MNDEELRHLWGKQKLAPARLSPGEQIELMRRKMKSLDRVLLTSDAFGIAMGTVLIPVFVWLVCSYLKTALLARVGLVIAVAGEAVSLGKQLRARRSSRSLAQSAAEEPVTHWLRHEL